MVKPLDDHSFYHRKMIHAKGFILISLHDAGAAILTRATAWEEWPTISPMPQKRDARPPSATGWTDTTTTDPISTSQAPHVLKEKSQQP
jgi:hypothetical protein